MLGKWLAATIAIALSTAHAQLPPLRSLSSTPACSTCSIVMEPGVTIVLPNDSLSFSYTSGLVRLGDGKFIGWDLNETRIPALFDVNGGFVRLLARSGTGPGEMGHVDGAFVARGDTVWIKDTSPWTWHVLAPDLKYLRREPLEPEPYDILFTPNGGAVVATDFFDALHAGYPLHIVTRNGSHVRSFGVERPMTPAEREDDSSVLLRFLTAGSSGSFWANAPSRFLLEHYDSAGRPLARLRHTLDGWYKEASEAQPGRGEFRGKALGNVVASSERDVVWLIYHVRNASFVPPRGTLELGAYSDMHDVVIEALDTRNYRVIASQRFPKLTLRNVRNAPDMMAAVRRLNDTFATFQIITLRLVRR